MRWQRLQPIHQGPWRLLVWQAVDAEANAQPAPMAGQPRRPTVSSLTLPPCSWALLLGAGTSTEAPGGPAPLSAALRAEPPQLSQGPSLGRNGHQLGVGERLRAGAGEEGNRPYLGWNCWPSPPFCPASALKRKSSQAQGDPWPHPTGPLNSSLQPPPPPPGSWAASLLHPECLSATSLPSSPDLHSQHRSWGHPDLGFSSF